MWGRFWFGTDAAAHGTEVGKAQLRSAGRTGAMLEQASPAEKTPLAEDQAVEIAEFLVRVYTHQQC